MTNPIIPIHKIIAFVVFICASLMTSLFVYHVSQKNAPALLPSEIGMLFKEPRDIKSFELVTANQQPFTEKSFYHHWTLVFFGFTHCSSVCPTTLHTIQRIYPTLQAKYPNLQVALVTVDPERDQLASLTQYVQRYNPAFLGITGNIQNIRKLQSQLGIYSARDNASNNDYQIEHTASILLINPQGKWAGLFKYGLKPEDLKKGIEISLRANYA